MTDQIEMEFLNNRQGVISSALGNLKAPAITAFAPACLADSKTAAAIDKNFKLIRKQIDLMKERFAKILKDPNINDQVFKSFKQIVANSVHNLKLAESGKKKQIVDLAIQRFQRGFPPRKKQDHSIGDAINWEWILDCAANLSASVLIVSRDGDFGVSLDKKFYLNDWLSQEFKERVSMKRKAELTPSLSQALKRLNVKVTAAEEREEQSIMKQTQVRPVPVAPFSAGVFPPFWHEVLKRVATKSPFMRAYLAEADQVTHVNNNLNIHFPLECCDHATLIDNPKTQAMLQTILSEVGVGAGVKITFTSPAQESSDNIADSEDTAPPDDVPF